MCLEVQAKPPTKKGWLRPTEACLEHLLADVASLRQQIRDLGRNAEQLKPEIVKHRKKNPTL
jgi:hypothetical protein